MGALRKRNGYTGAWHVIWPQSKSSTLSEPSIFSPSRRQLGQNGTRACWTSAATSTPIAPGSGALPCGAPKRAIFQCPFPTRGSAPANRRQIPRPTMSKWFPSDKLGSVEWGATDLVGSPSWTYIETSVQATFSRSSAPPVSRRPDRWRSLSHCPETTMRRLHGGPPASSLHVAPVDRGRVRMNRQRYGERHIRCAFLKDSLSLVP